MKKVANPLVDLGLEVDAGRAACHDARSMSDLSEGELVARRRKKLRLNQQALAKLAGISLGTMLRIEKDRNTQRENFDAVIAALVREEKRRGIAQQRPTVSAPPAITEPLKEGAADVSASAKLRQALHRLERIEVFLVETLEDVRRAKADIADDSSEGRRKQG